MFVRYGWGHFRFALAALVLTAAAGPRQAAAWVDGPSQACVQRFLKAYSGLTSYETRMHKREWDGKGSLTHDELIALTFTKPANVRFEYLNRGSTGIRNNGMVIRLAGDRSSKVDIQLGKPDAWGFLAKAAASLVVPSQTSLYDPLVVNSEIFTLNRAGFGFLATALSHQLEGIRLAKSGGLTYSGSDSLSLTRAAALRPEAVLPGCEIRYTPHAKGVHEVLVVPTDSIAALEDRYGVLAYFIYLENQDRFSAFADLFARKQEMKLKIPRAFTEFVLELEDSTALPKRVALFWRDQLIGDYQFEKTVVHAR